MCPYSLSAITLNLVIMRLNNIIIIILAITGMSSCIEPFVPDTAEYENSIFIEALVTDDEDTAPAVKISANMPLKTRDDDYYEPGNRHIDGAEVFIICDDGNEYQLSNVRAGVYKAVDPVFTGEVGKSYKLIIYYDGEVFESGFQKLKPPVPIDSISYKVDEQKVRDDGDASMGYKFLVSNHADAPGPSYYRWMPSATFFYFIPFQADFIWGFSGLAPYDNSDVKRCWMTQNIPGIYLSTTEGLAENIIAEAALHFESQHGDALSRRYRLQVKQLSITAESYYFWKDLDKLVNQTGGLYETQPFRLDGNIKCTSDPASNITGIFEVAGVSEAVRYFNKPEEFPVIRFSCTKDTIGTESLTWDMLDSGSIIIYEGKDNLYFTSDAWCFDCTLRGGTTEEPSFWYF